MTLYSQQNLYERLKALWADKKKIREPWESPCDSMIDNFRPDMTKFGDDHDHITFPSQYMYDSFPAWALGVMDKGFRGYTISRAIEWFRHQTADRDLQGNDDVNQWIELIDEHQRSVYQRSNLYSVAGAFCRQALSTGSPVMVIEEDEESGRNVCFVPHPRQRYIGHNLFGDPDQLVIEWEYSIKEAVDRFGLENLKQSTQNRYKQGKHTERVKFLQFCLHHKDPVFKDLPEGSEGPKRLWPNMYIQRETDPDKEKALYPLKNGKPRYGYHERNFVVWHYAREWPYDYAFTPCWFARFDAKGFQQMRKTLIMAVQRAVAPPMFAASWLKDNLKLYPNYINWYEGPEQREDIPQPIGEKMNYPFGKDMEISAKENLERWFHIPFFQMLTRLIETGGSPPTATQILGMQGEKSVLLGPTIETQEDEWLRPQDNIFLTIEYRAGRLPEPPPIIFDRGGTTLLPEFIGPLHQSQQEFHNQRKHETILAAAAPYFEYFPFSKYKIKAEVALEDLLEKRGYLQDAIATEEEYNAIVSAYTQKQEMREGLEMAEQASKILPALEKAPEEGSPAKQLMEG